VVEDVREVAMLIVKRLQLEQQDVNRNLRVIAKVMKRAVNDLGNREKRESERECVFERGGEGGARERMCVLCVCVCVCERESVREREREKDNSLDK
jgi:hypothetical protein